MVHDRCADVLSARGRRARKPFAIGRSPSAAAVFALALLCFSGAASADERVGKIAAHPALWTVRSTASTVYLFGSIHLLPANLSWRTPQIDRALDAAGTFVFEAPIGGTGRAEIADFIRRNGSLPKGTTLRALLSKKTLTDYEHALALAHLAPAALDGDRPWLAALILDVAYLQQLHYLAADGVDQQIFALAQTEKKAVRYFETPTQQLSLFMPKNKKLEMAEFEIGLREFQSEQNGIGAMTDAWGAGDVKTVGRLMNKDLEHEPGAKKLLIDDRNRAWIKNLDEMLAAPGIYFVTVGAGHLVGRAGIPALLRAQGYRVEEPS